MIVVGLSYFSNRLPTSLVFWLGYSQACPSPNYCYNCTWAFL